MDDFDRMYETNEARFYAQHYLNQSRNAVSDASGSVRVEDVMSGSASMEDYQPVEEQPKITEDMLQFDGEFVQAAKDVYFMFEDKEFLGTPEEAAKYGIDLMGEFNYNFAGPVGFSGQPGMVAQLAEIMVDASPAQANSWLHLMGRYDQLPVSKAGTWRFIRGVLSDPTTYLGLGTAGVGIAARAGTKEVAKRTGIAAIKNRIAALSQKAVENPAKSGAIAGAVMTAPETAGVQEVKEIAGYEQTPEERALELVTNVGIGAATGAGLAKGVDEVVKVAPQVVRAVSDIISPQEPEFVSLRHGSPAPLEGDRLQVARTGTETRVPGVYFDTKGGRQSATYGRLGRVYEARLPANSLAGVLDAEAELTDVAPEVRQTLIDLAAEAGLSLNPDARQMPLVGSVIGVIRDKLENGNQRLVEAGISGQQRPSVKDMVVWDQNLLDSAELFDVTGKTPVKVQQIDNAIRSETKVGE